MLICYQCCVFQDKIFNHNIPHIENVHRTKPNVRIVSPPEEGSPLKLPTISNLEEGSPLKLPTISNIAPTMVSTMTSLSNLGPAMASTLYQTCASKTYQKSPKCLVTSRTPSLTSSQRGNYLASERDSSRDQLPSCPYTPVNYGACSSSQSAVMLGNETA